MGNYQEVFNKGNIGRYALAIGKKESFTPWGLVAALFKARSLDKWFFKPGVGGVNMELPDKKIIGFSKNDKGNWQIVNDVVMGGISQGQITITDSDTAVFQGKISLENNGGFASVRTTLGDYLFAGYDGVIIKIKGDGRTYQFNARTDDRFDGVFYKSEFQTIDGQWITLKLPFQKFIPTFHGRIVSDAPELDPGKIRQIGFLIADKKEGPFKLEIEWIGAYTEG